jgi:hypothetical protein
MASGKHGRLLLVVDPDELAMYVSPIRRQFD